MVKALLFLFSALAVSLNVLAVSADSSISITSTKNSYEFIYNKKTGQVEVKEVLNTIYTNETYSAKLPVSELYNSNVTIDDVSARVDNHSVRDFKPIYQYYSTDDIFFSDEKICYFPLLLTKKGSNAEVVFKETVDDPRYFTSIFFPDYFRVKQKEVIVKIPRWMKADLKEMNFGNYHITRTTAYDSKNDADIITYVMQDLPAMQHEDNSPGPTYIYPHLLVLCKSAIADNHTFKYFGSLEDQYAWYQELAKSVNNDKAIITTKAKELTIGISGDMDKIKAIFYYVQDNIRYLAFEDGMAGFKPEKADEVLRKKYGDCKGMANLTKELLCALGYDARLCWLGTDHIAYNYQTPSLAVDNHMICALMFKGKTIYLDATETYLGINEYAERIQGRQVLIQDGDKYILTHIPVADQAQNYDYELSKLVISGEDLTGNVIRLWKGEDKEEVLSGLNSVKKENTDEAMNRFLSDNNVDYAITNLTLSPTDNPDKDMKASYAVDIKNGVSTFSKAYYVDLDRKKEFIKSSIKPDEHKYDYWFSHKVNLCEETELTLPANYKAAALPPALNIVNPDYEFHIQYNTLAGKIIYKKRILIKNTHLPVSRFAQWNKDIGQLGKAYNETLTLNNN